MNLWIEARAVKECSFEIMIKKLCNSAHGGINHILNIKLQLENNV